MPETFLCKGMFNFISVYFIVVSCVGVQLTSLPVDFLPGGRKSAGSEVINTRDVDINQSATGKLNQMGRHQVS